MDRRVVLILSLVVAFTGVLMVVKGRSRPNNVIDLSVAQPSGVQQAAKPDGAKKDADAPPPDFPEPQKGSVAPDFSLKSLPDGKEYPALFAARQSSPREFLGNVVRALQD